ncbi:MULTISPECIES: TetR/AcrR family transcriptional regulator [unclassified Rhodococcus (in: high G+C Gram-positive bacteria)]|uniref:TetR/AcrR family transcriptional regulator n=1 Tax=unclassified Rhodococcus (in: high G+C Gram-positive bacteria) TaxID=192944 RepID=UPI00163AA670|nr:MULTISPECIES: TetR/AcrR family transcriptional regulator [unclassified Rhodococcus (in: high G+C Gram-positive bacteria)]MBC2644379.1 TetR/AcrR family transcriptional regulator [Rhodococcus sp. 3A]MBC2897929.1 TetR/AcrR family transcriptional regulator [Rhodococcus sp. 4CII]
MQKRAEITGEALLLAAAVEFTRVCYADARLETILTRANVSRGALYDHFGSKEELARAVIEAGSARFQGACEPLLAPRIPAFEALIGISCLLLDPVVHDVTVQATFRLLTEIRDRPGAPTLLATWLSDYRDLARRAIAEGDLRAEDPDAVAELLVETFTGVHLLAAATGHVDELPARWATSWDLLLPGLLDPIRLDHFRRLATRYVAGVPGRRPALPPSVPPHEPRQPNRGKRRRPSPRTRRHGRGEPPTVVAHTAGN